MSTFIVKLVVVALVVALWITTMLSFGNYVRGKTRCEMQHGTYAQLNRERVCIAPGGVKVIDVEHP